MKEIISRKIEEVEIKTGDTNLEIKTGNAGLSMFNVKQVPIERVVERVSDKPIVTLYIFPVDMDHIGPYPRLSITTEGKEFFLAGPKYSDVKEYWTLINFFGGLGAKGLVELKTERMLLDDFKFKKEAI